MARDTFISGLNLRAANHHWAAGKVGQHECSPHVSCIGQAYSVPELPPAHVSRCPPQHGMQDALALCVEDAQVGVHQILQSLHGVYAVRRVNNGRLALQQGRLSMLCGVSKLPPTQSAGILWFWALTLSRRVLAPHLAVPHLQLAASQARSLWQDNVCQLAQAVVAAAVGALALLPVTQGSRGRVQARFGLLEEVKKHVQDSLQNALTAWLDWPNSSRSA